VPSRILKPGEVRVLIKAAALIIEMNWCIEKVCIQILPERNSIGFSDGQPESFTEMVKGLISACKLESASLIPALNWGQKSKGAKFFHLRLWECLATVLGRNL